MLSHILSKVERLEKILKGMKEDVSTLNQTVTSHLVATKKSETQMCHISSYLNPRQQGGLPSDTIANPKSETYRISCVVPRHLNKVLFGRQPKTICWIYF